MLPPEFPVAESAGRGDAWFVGISGGFREPLQAVTLGRTLPSGEIVFVRSAGRQGVLSSLTPRWAVQAGFADFLGWSSHGSGSKLLLPLEDELVRLVEGTAGEVRTVRSEFRGIVAELMVDTQRMVVSVKTRGDGPLPGIVDVDDWSKYALDIGQTFDADQLTEARGPSLDRYYPIDLNLEPSEDDR